MNKKSLIIIPTYNEKRNISILVNKIFHVMKKDFDILFIDDNSPDGTSFEIKKIQKVKKNIKLIIRSKKMGIGSAHKFGILYGYKKKYKIIITMDCDGTHDPKFLKKMLPKLKHSDLVTTNRFIKKNSLSSWPFYRKALTYFRHFIIKIFLNISYDSSGAFRCYNTKTINYNDIILARDNGYSFFWESIFIFTKKNYKIAEIPITLPNRIAGGTKMRLRDIFFAFYYLIKIFIKNLFFDYR